MAQKIQIKRSTTTTAPTAGTLSMAELAYTEVGGIKRLFVGQADNSTAFEIGGQSYALLASPTFTGTPLAPTATLGTNTTQIATTAFVLANAASKTLTSAQIFVGNASNVATAVTVTGDASIDNTGVVTIANNAVSNAKAAQMATLTLKGNNTGSTANASDLTVAQVNTMLGSSTPTASTLAKWDANVNLSANNLISAITSIATSTGVTLTIASTYIQRFTSAAGAQTLILPNVSTGVNAGLQYLIQNESSATIAVQTSGGGALTTVNANSDLLLTLATAGTQAGVWHVQAIASVNATTGSVLFSGGGSTVSQDNANFFYDNTNDRLGLGTNSPTYKLDVRDTTTTQLALTSTGAQGANNGAGLTLIQNNGAAMTTGNAIGTIHFTGANTASSVIKSAYIQAVATENWGTGKSGTKLDFYITNSNTNTSARAMTINASGFVESDYGFASGNTITIQSVTDALVATYTGPQGPNNYYNISMYTNDGSAMQAGNAIGGLLFGGANNSISGLSTGALIFAQASENWNITANGADLVFQTTPNGAITQQTTLVLRQDKSAEFANNGTFAGNVKANNWINGITSTVTTGSTTTLTTTSANIQRFTGGATQTVILPSSITITPGTAYNIYNDSTGIITVQDAAGNLLSTVGARSDLTFTLAVSAGPAGTWHNQPVELSASLTSANIYVGNSVGVATGVQMTGDVTITNTGVTTVGSATPTASIVAKWDASKNLSANNFINSITSIATSGGTTTLFATSAGIQRFTGATTQIVVLPNATTLSNGIQYIIQNESTGVIIVQASGTGTTLATVAPKTDSTFILSVNGTQAGTWHVDVNLNFSANNLINGITSTATTGGTRFLAITSTGIQRFTGSTTHTVVLPDSTILSNGIQYLIQNESSGAITVQANGTGATLATVATGTDMTFTLAAAGTAAGVWHFVTPSVSGITALTGDVTASGTGSVVSTIASNAVTNAKLAQMATLTLKGNNTGGTANASDLTVAQVNTMLGSTTPTASTLAKWDSNINFKANNLLNSITSTATAAGTTTLTVTSTGIQRFTGATTQTVVLPDATTLSTGTQYLIQNESSGAVTVQASGTGTTLASANANNDLMLTLTSNGTAAGTWHSVAPAQFDGNNNLSSNNFISAINSTATAGATTTLTVTSNAIQRFTGTSTQTVALPNATTLTNGMTYTIFNDSINIINVNNGSGTLLETVLPGNDAKFTLAVNTTTAGTWFVQATGISSTASGYSLIQSVSTDVSGIAQGYWLASGLSAGIYYSLDGSNWVQTPQTTLVFNKFQYINGKYYAFGRGNVYTASSVTGTWTTIAGNPWSIAYSPTLGMMVAVFNGAGIKYSRDNGATWTNSNITAVILYDVKWGGSMFVAMGSNTSTSLYYSSNGTAWTAVNIGYMPNLLFYVGGVWFVNHVFGWVYSFDGINWVTFNVISGTGLSNSSSSSSLATLAVYGKGLYIVGTTLGIYYSSDGANWSQVTGGSAGNSIGAVIYENNIFVASGSSTISTGMYYSYDGINWTTAATTIGTVQSLGFANGLFIATSANTGANGFWTSTDANTWTRQTSGQVNVTAVQYVSSSACNLSYNVGFGTTSSNAFKEYHSGLIYSQGQMFQNNGAPVSSPANVTSTKAGTDRINAVTPYTLAQALPILTLNSGRIVVGNASNTPAGVVMSGDATITNAGVVTVGTTTPTLSTVAKWDAFTNLTANNLVNYIVSTVTSGGTITLAASSAGTQRFTGSTTHTAILPNATTLTNGTQYLIQNESSGGITIQTNGGGAFTTVPGNADVLLTLVSNGVAAGTWHAQPAAFTSALTSANIFVGNASNVATGVAVTGDITLSNTGVMRVASSAVGNGLTGGSGTVISVLPDTTTTNMAAVSVSANGAGVLTDGTSIVYAGGILSASVIDCGTF